MKDLMYLYFLVKVIVRLNLGRNFRWFFNGQLTVNLSILACTITVTLPSRPASIPTPFKIFARVHLPDVRWTFFIKKTVTEAGRDGNGDWTER